MGTGLGNDWIPGASVKNYIALYACGVVDGMGKYQPDDDDDELRWIARFPQSASCCNYLLLRMVDWAVDRDLLQVDDADRVTLTDAGAALRDRLRYAYGLRPIGEGDAVEVILADNDVGCDAPYCSCVERFGLDGLDD